MAKRDNEINIVRLHGRVPAVAGESSGFASSSSPDGTAGVWTHQLSNPGTEPSVLQEHQPATIIH